MSNIHKRNRLQHRLTVLDKALDVYEHTTNLLANEKVFKRTYQGLIDKLDNEATMIYHCCRVANEELDARVVDEAKMRIQLQKEAISHCKWLKTYIMLSGKKFHLRARQVIYWNELVNTAMTYITAWNRSEIKAYKENMGCRL